MKVIDKLAGRKRSRRKIVGGPARRGKRLWGWHQPPLATGSSSSASAGRHV